MSKKYKLVPQTYGLAMAQGHFGGPTGIYVECITCNNAAKIVHDDPSRAFSSLNNDEIDAMSDEEAESIFRSFGWSVLPTRCPTCRMNDLFLEAS